MDLSDKAELEAALGRITRAVGFQEDEDLLDEYLHGKRPRLLSYEKLDSEAEEFPALSKYIVGARSYLRQPNVSLVYDIYRAGRIISLTRALDLAIQHCINKKVREREERFERLKAARSLDEFESVLYELVVAARYASLPSTSQLEFLEETAEKQPDMQATISGTPFFIECKKPNRIADFSIATRDLIRKLTAPVMLEMKERRQSALVELTLETAPENLDAARLQFAILEAIDKNRTVKRPGYTIEIPEFNPPKIDGYLLFPSPQFYWSRYQFKNAGKWQGIVNSLEARPVSPTWIDDVTFECAIKWRITDEKVLWKQRRFGYDLFFKGIGQLATTYGRTILHVWFERDLSVGHRRNELLDFLPRVKPLQAAHLSWIVFNEILVDITPKGRIDFTEHAHFASGPNRYGAEPPATCAFVGLEDYQQKKGEFGIGAILPDLDSIEDAGPP